MQKIFITVFIFPSLVSCAYKGGSGLHNVSGDHGLSYVEEFRDPKPPLRDEILPRGSDITGNIRTRNDGIEIAGINNQYSGFTLTNRGSPRINPEGLKPQNTEVTRSYSFRFTNLARQAIHLMVEDYPIQDGMVSHTTMLSSFYFFPRHVIPAVKLHPAQKEAEVTLPTGEKVFYSTDHWEIVRGVLKEDAPMDYNPDRHKRRFSAISYTGKGVVIRIDQRGESPENEAPWGQNTGKLAVITSGNRKPCKVAPRHLWDQSAAGYFDFLYPRDDDFRQKILVERCGWRDFKFEL